MLKFLKGKKTFLFTILAVISALIGFATNQIDMTECVTVIITSFGVGTLRADMIPALSFLAKYRAYFVMAGGIVVAMIAFVTGSLSLVGLITAIISALGFGSFSAGIKKFVS